MKNIYSVRHLMAFLSFFCCCSGNLFAQTMPTPQELTPNQDLTLTYEQNFNSLPASSATYPAGFQGWTANGGAPGTEYSAALSATDQNLRANSTAGLGTGGVHNYNGKIGFLDTSNLDLAIGFAFVATGHKNLQVKYDAMVIRNPYNGTSNLCIYEMALQYRVGASGPFITLPETAYLSNKTVHKDAGLTDPINSTNIKVVLPATCNFQPLVQIRWIAKQVIGGGSRPSFAIDNLDIREDVAAPINNLGYPKTNNILSDSFDFINKIDEIGKTYYALVPAGSAAPSVAQVKAGNDGNNVAALQSGFLTISKASQEYLQSFAGLSLGTSYSVFSVSEDPYGNVQTAVNKVDVTTSNVVIPVLSSTVTSLSLFAEPTYTSEASSYQIQATDLTNDVVVTSSSSNFTLSKDNSTFASSITYSVSDFASNATPTVYVKFTPTALGNSSGQISHTTTGGVTKTVTLSGAGINPYEQGFNDSNVLTNSGWTQYNVSGPLNKWVATTSAKNINSGAGAVLINGYSDNGPSKDWLISPKLHLDTFTNYALLSFYSRKYYAGPGLKLMVSSDYDGKSNPETATWTELQGDFPAITNIYTKSQYIKLDAYKTSPVYLAWVYETTKGGNTFAAEWSLDDIKISNETAYLVSNPVLDLDDTHPGEFSASQSFVLKGEGYGDITITASSSYQVSLDNSSFLSNVTVSAADAAAGKPVYVRFAPIAKEVTITGILTATGTSLNKQIGTLTATSIPKVDTFDIATYNLEFFASDVKDATGKEFGPTDDILQVENVAKVMNKLNADVYVVQEVSNDGAIDDLIKQININGKTFDKTISTSWSYSHEPESPTFPPQKLVVLYNTKTTTVKATKVMFKGLYDELLAGTKTLTNYPVASPAPVNPSASFFSSGRLPYMVQLETNIGGVKKLINVVDLHARANSGADIVKYNQRKYDTQVLKDSLDQYYANHNLIILGDFNDDVKASVVGTNNPSTYENFVVDQTRYNALTLGLSQQGKNSYFNFTPESFLDHIVISNELNDQYIANSISVYDPRADIVDYINTTSDHGPVIARFNLKEDVLSTIDFETKNGYFVQAFPNPVSDVVNVSVKTTTDRNLKLRFYDISGHLVGNPVEVNATQDLSTTAIPVSYLRSGIYVYTLTENNKVVYKGKIIKK
ncbi:T9SS type A sorting domain-containing protein [Flavobacterium sp. FlaQc-48]|uniref:T9SS type A sorting domain-containing protein n=1 Tax=Flavobacterium sp. FlaQc-48 TaxID=3374181 RepID=UPI00375708CC